MSRMSHSKEPQGNKSKPSSCVWVVKEGLREIQYSGQVLKELRE